MFSFSHGTSHSARVMILFNRFSGNLINHTSDISGHWLTMVIKFNGVNYILLCVYGCKRRTQNKLFYPSLSWLLEGWKVTSTTDKITVGRDFNLVPDLWLDCLPPKGQCHYCEEIINKANTVIFQFMWRNKTHYIRRSQLVKEYDKGGIKAPEFESMVVPITPRGSTFQGLCLKNIGGLDFILKWDFEVNRIPIKLSNFHKQIHFWKMMFTHNFPPRNSTCEVRSF